MESRVRAPRMIGESASFLEMQEHISAVAPLNKPLLIVGERGTGKELVAARLHFLSRRWEQNFLKINCAAMSETLLEAQLFGHEAGAYTGATKLRKGYFERANGGTLFLDELANTDMAVQEKILRVIEYGEFERLGGNETLSVDVRIIAATNEDLPQLAAEHRFREDLLDRLAFDVITLPPLRERAEDILVLAEHFAIAMVKEVEGEFFAGFSEDVERALLAYAWPGNIRELKNVVERAVYHHGEDVVTSLIFNPFESPYRPKPRPRAAEPGGAVKTAAQAQAETDQPTSSVRPEAAPDLSALSSFDFKEQVQDYEIRLLKQAMAQNQYNQKKAAEFLNLSYHQLRGYLRKYDLLG